MGCCNELDWSEVDQTLEHHPLCDLDQFATGVLASLRIDIAPVRHRILQHGGLERVEPQFDGDTYRVFVKIGGQVVHYHRERSAWSPPCYLGEQPDLSLVFGLPTPHARLVQERRMFGWCSKHRGEHLRESGCLDFQVKVADVTPFMVGEQDRFVPACNSNYNVERTLEGMRAALVGKSITITGLGEYQSSHFPVDEITEDAQGFHARSHERNASLLIFPESVIHIHERHHDPAPEQITVEVDCYADIPRESYLNSAFVQAHARSAGKLVDIVLRNVDVTVLPRVIVDTGEVVPMLVEEIQRLRARRADSE